MPPVRGPLAGGRCWSPKSTPPGPFPVLPVDQGARPGRGAICDHPGMNTLANGRIRHSVVFTPTHAEGSAKEADLLAAIQRLAAIPGVEAFELMREVSPKNDYRYGLMMEFADAAAYRGYNDHRDHVAFVQQRWETEVGDFLEIDTVAL
jgi:Stress responsive A/B Barrel Domain